MRANEVKKIYSQMIESGEKEYSLEDGKVKIFDFLKRNYNEQIRIVVHRKSECLNSLEIFNAWEISDGKFKKISLDFFYFSSSSSLEEDAIFKKRKKSLKDFLYGMLDSSEKSEFIYFCFPLYEKFCKIYLNWRKESSHQVLFFLEDFFRIVKRDESQKAEDDAILNLLSNKKLKDLGFGKKENSFLKKLFSEKNFEYRYLGMGEVFKKMNPEIFKEIGEAEKEGIDIFKYFANKTYHEGITVTDNSFVQVFKGERMFFKNGAQNIYIEGTNHGLIEKSFSLVVTLYKNKMSIIKAFRYLENVQCEQFLSKGESVVLYNDYLNMSFKLFNSFEKYPKRLKTMHDKVVDVFNKADIKIDDISNARIIEKYSKLSFLEGDIDDEHCIVLPSESKDITSEGKALAHCVGSYISRVAENDTTILFIRKKNKKRTPLYTAEIRNGRISQLKGRANSAVPINVREALENRLKNIIKMKKGA